MNGDAMHVLNKQLLGDGRYGLFTDIDGTISQIAPTPSAAVVDPACREALRRLAMRWALVAVVSGRTARDAQRMVALRGLIYVGNHGLEIWRHGLVTTPPEVG